MIGYSNIKEVHIELSSNCNAACPFCPRTFYGFPYDPGFPTTELTLQDIKSIFEESFIQQLDHLLVNGNLGDFMLAKEGIEIIEYFREVNPQLFIEISTNGSARTADYWIRLAKTKSKVQFCLDGLEDTHHLYRRNTDFNTILKNAETYINAGGFASWKMIRFPHNVHQVEQCRELSKELGFEQFELIDEGGRDQGNVYDKQGNYIYSIGAREVMFDRARDLLDYVKEVIFVKKEIYQQEIKKSISCYAKKYGSIYVAADGTVYPCCYLGFYPDTFDPALYAGNEQIKELLKNFNNNAKEKPLKDCLEWFNQVEESWAEQSFADGRLYRCNHHCGN